MEALPESRGRGWGAVPRARSYMFIDFAALIQECWDTGAVPTDWCCTSMVLIPQPHQQGMFRGIALLSTGWKVLTRIITNRLEGIPLHPIQHGFRARTGVAEAIATRKLYVQAARLRNERLLACYVDLTRAYDSVDRTRLVELLHELGVGRPITRLLEFAFDTEQVALRMNGIYSDTFRTTRGVKQRASSSARACSTL
jgi:hypothetical protein